MSYNDPIGEWIRPKYPDIFEKIRPPSPLHPKTPVKRSDSCPDIEIAIATEECKLADQQGYIFWDDLFTVMSKRLRFAFSVKVAREALDLDKNSLGNSQSMGENSCLMVKSVGDNRGRKSVTFEDQRRG